MAKRALTLPIERRSNSLANIRCLKTGHTSSNYIVPHLATVKFHLKPARIRLSTRRGGKKKTKRKSKSIESIVSFGAARREHDRALERRESTARRISFSTYVQHTYVLCRILTSIGTAARLRGACTQRSDISRNDGPVGLVSLILGHAMTN